MLIYLTVIFHLFNNIFHLFNCVFHLFNYIFHLFNCIFHLFNCIFHSFNRVFHLFNCIFHLFNCIFHLFHRFKIVTRYFIILVFNNSNNFSCMKYIFLILKTPSCTFWKKLKCIKWSIYAPERYLTVTWNLPICKLCKAQPSFFE